MIPASRGNTAWNICVATVTRAFIVAGFLFLAQTGWAQLPPGFGGGSSGPTYTPLGTWSFSDRYGWTSDKGYSPVSFTNLAYSYLGDGASLVVDSNNPAWLAWAIFSTSTGALTILCFSNKSVKISLIIFLRALIGFWF